MRMNEGKTRSRKVIFLSAVAFAVGGIAWSVQAKEAAAEKATATRKATAAKKIDRKPAKSQGVARGAQVIPVPRKMEPFEGVDVVLMALDEFEKVCMDSKGKVLPVAVTNAEILANDEDGAIDCYAAAYKIGLHLERLEEDAKKAEKDPEFAQLLKEYQR